MRMIFSLLAHAWSLQLDLIWLGRRAEQDKDLEILLLRQQLCILQRHRLGARGWVPLGQAHVGRPCWQTDCLDEQRSCPARSALLLFEPKTLLKWHCELVRRKWTSRMGAPRGRTCAGSLLLQRDSQQMKKGASKASDYSVNMFSVRNIWLVAPNSCACTVRLCGASAACSRERRTNSSTVGRAIHKPTTRDGSNIASVWAVDLLAFDPANNLSRSAVDRIT